MIICFLQNMSTRKLTFSPLDGEMTGCIAKKNTPPENAGIYGYIVDTIS